MVSEEYTLTRPAYEALQRELEDLEASQDGLMAQLSDIQNDMGISSDEEGAEFDTRSRMDYVTERITYLRDVLQRAEIVDEDPNPRGADQGERVYVTDLSTDERFEFDLRSSEEVTYLGSGISVESPVGSALLGKAVGDECEIETPEGTVRYRIERIERLAQ